MRRQLPTANAAIIFKLAWSAVWASAFKAKKDDTFCLYHPTKKMLLFIQTFFL